MTSSAGTERRRPSRGSLLLTVSIGHAETQEWASDEAFRVTLVRDAERRARERGRKFVEVYDAAGVRLHVGGVGP